MATRPRIRGRCTKIIFVIWCLLILSVSFVLVRLMLRALRLKPADSVDFVTGQSFSILCVVSAIILLVVLFIWDRRNARERDQRSVSKPHLEDYGYVIHLGIHADKLNWDRLYYFLVFNSIMIAGWIILFSADDAARKAGCLYLLIGLSLFGLLVSVLWALFAISRGIKFHDYYMWWARCIEQETRASKNQPGIFLTQDSFTKGASVHFHEPNYYEILNDVKLSYFGRMFGARETMAMMPWLFAIAYLGLLVLSFAELPS